MLFPPKNTRKQRLFFRFFQGWEGAYKMSPLKINVVQSVIICNMDFGLLVRDRVQSSFLILNDFERINQFLFPLEIIRKAMIFWCLLGECKLINLLKILLILELKSGDHPGSQFFYKCAYYCLVTPGVLHLNPVSIYLLKVNNKNTRARYEICSKLTIKTPERSQ